MVKLYEFCIAFVANRVGMDIILIGKGIGMNSPTRYG